jgi:acetoin utilization protein AcuB
MKDVSKLTVGQVMTKAPRSIEPHQPAELARKWMDELKVRHLPVRDSGKVVGILSDRDLNLVLGATITSRGGLKPAATVEDAMSSGVRGVVESRPVTDVAKEMLEHHVGSVLVMGADGGLVGIFTDSDALRILAGQV